MRLFAAFDRYSPIILALLLIAIVQFLPGCAIFSKEPLAKKQLVSCANPNPSITAVCNEAVDMVEKSNILVAMINTSVDNQFNAKLLTKSQAQGYRDRTKQADAQLDNATKSIQSFNFSTALTQANATKFLLEALEKEVAAQVAKGQQ